MFLTCSKLPNRLLAVCLSACLPDCSWFMFSFVCAVPSAPLDLDVTIVGPGAVHLLWNPPTARNGIIVKYIVLYSPVQDWPLAHWFNKVENGNALQIMFHLIISLA